MSLLGCKLLLAVPGRNSSSAWNAVNVLGAPPKSQPTATAHSTRGAQLRVCCSDSKPQRGNPGRRRYVLPPIYLTRSDLAWGSPPWRFEQTCFVEDLDLHRHVPALTGGAGRQHVVVRFSVDSPSHSARGLWLKGTVETRLLLACEWCDAGFSEEVLAAFDVWLNGEVADDREVTSAEELAFPESDDSCDLTPVVVDAISLALPSVCLCGGASCGQFGSQPKEWASTAQAGTSSGPLAALLRGAQRQGSAKRRRSKAKKI
ncbi:hypothetical protein N2152v2_002398 [Parachlorella kessleri]